MREVNNNNNIITIVTKHGDSYIYKVNTDREDNNHVLTTSAKYCDCY